MMKPRLIRRISSSQGSVTTAGRTEVYRQVLDPAVARVIAAYMRKTVTGGTASRAAVRGYRVCGKTGSAEVSDNKEVETNAWFTGFIDDEDHPYAISVVIEKGGAGSRMPSELAAKALERAVTYIG